MINGIINIYKEKGYTSHDVVAVLRGICKQKKIGHTGTLDPDAEGVLPVCFGSATKLCEFLTDKNKEYIAVMKLGIETDTQDTTGTILDKREVHVSEEEILKTILSFQGEQTQIPPMYSAVKVNGKKLYEFAREGIEIERSARKITVHKIEVLSIDGDEVKLKVLCSKGTYIRTICHDIGKKLGCNAAMSSLVRSRSGDFDIENAITLQEVEALAKSDELNKYCITTEQVFSKLKRISTKPEFDKFLMNGNVLGLEQTVTECLFEPNEEVRVYNSLDYFCAVYRYDEIQKLFKPVKMFLQSL